MTASAMGSCGGVFDCSYLEEVVANRLDTEMPRAELEAKIERIAAFDRDLVAAGTTVVRRRSRSTTVPGDLALQGRIPQNRGRRGRIGDPSR
ncbi:MAG TPA: hypothetical protein VEC09_00050 [Actinomycetota bacterium]|nr:hypothetical protein [Actinomycetota bacterium]